MFNVIKDFFGSIEFFNSASFGISALILNGCLGCFPGLIMGDAPKKRIDPGLVQIFAALAASVLSLVIIISISAYPTGPAWAVALTCASCFYTGLSNFIMLLLMSRAMQSGPNGIIWAIIQSAFIFPFIVSIMFFGVELTWMRLAGIILLVSALVFFGCAKDNSGRGGRWKLLAFICLGMCAFQQNITTLPSYFPETFGVPSIVRSFCEAAAIVITGTVYNLIKMTPQRRGMIKENLRSPSLWKYVAVLQNFHVIIGYALFYPGLNAMAKHGMGGMSFSIITASCIISFTVAGILFLKERLNTLQTAGLACCISGLVFLCTKA